jgi:hypothetical protein
MELVAALASLPHPVRRDCIEDDRAARRQAQIVTALVEKPLDAWTSGFERNARLWNSSYNAHWPYPFRKFFNDIFFTQNRICARFSKSLELGHAPTNPGRGAEREERNFFI